MADFISCTVANSPHRREAHMESKENTILQFGFHLFLDQYLCHKCLKNNNNSNILCKLEKPLM